MGVTVGGGGFDGHDGRAALTSVLFSLLQAVAAAAGGVRWRDR